jgi:hypothetical protein
VSPSRFVPFPQNTLLVLHPYTCLILARITTFASAAAFSAATFSAIAFSAAALASVSAFAFAAAFASAAAFKMPSYSQLSNSGLPGNGHWHFQSSENVCVFSYATQARKRATFTYCMSYSGNLRCQRKFALLLRLRDRESISFLELMSFLILQTGCTEASWVLAWFVKPSKSVCMFDKENGKCFNMVSVLMLSISPKQNLLLLQTYVLSTTRKDYYLRISDSFFGSSFFGSSFFGYCLLCNSLGLGRCFCCSLCLGSRL